VSQAEAILPSNTPAGDGTFTVTYNGKTSAPVAIHVVNGSEGIFTRNQAGTGPAIVQNYNSNTDMPLNGLTEAARPGQMMVLWGTGLGPVTSDETQPPPPPYKNVRDDVEVWVGNKLAAVGYSGRSPNFPSVDQINFTLPSDVPLGCYVPLAIKLGNAAPVTSNFTTIAITSQGKTCSDANGLPSKDWGALQNGGTLNIGWLQLLRLNITANIPGLGSGTGLLDSGWGSLFRWNAVTGLSDQGVDMFTGRGVSLGGCSVFTFYAGGATWIPWRANSLDGGAALNVTGPKGSGQLGKTSHGYYDAQRALGAAAPTSLGFTLRPPFLEPGTITVDNNSGGADVGRFKAMLTIPASPAPLAWTNLDAISASAIDRSADLTFTRNGGDPNSEYAVLAGAVMLPDLLTQPMQVAAGFLCTEKISAGRFTVPAAVLSALPASTVNDPNSGMLLVGRVPLLTDSLKFTAPGLDIGYLTYAVFTGTTATFR
jgi:uncharacterized protein (TIGR03437 family)